MTTRARTRPSATAEPHDALAIPEFLHVTTEDGSYAYDPSDAADVQRVSALTGVPVEHIPHTTPQAVEEPTLVRVELPNATLSYAPAEPVDVSRIAHLLAAEGFPVTPEELAVVQPGTVLRLVPEPE